MMLVGANVAAVAVVFAAGGWDVTQIYTGVGLDERNGPPMQLVAHRGDLDEWPEDTLESISAATALAVDGIEFDTIMSADGTWWVIHDPTLDRTTDAEGYIPELPDEVIEAARVDGGVGFDPDGHVDLRVPTLASVLDALTGYDGMVYVDVQHAPTGDVADVVRLLEGRRAAILCRNLVDSQTVERLDPTVETYLRTEDGPADDTVDGWLMESFFEADAGTVQSSSLPVTTFVEDWRGAGDEAGLIRRAWSIGVEAFLTKAPRAALAARAELAGGS